MKEKKPRELEETPEKFEVPRLETSRLILRNPTVDDASDLYEFCKLPEVARFVTWDTHQSIDDSVAYLNEVERTQGDKRILWALEEKETGKMIGNISLIPIDRELKKAVLGWQLSPEFQGTGLMTEAANAVFSYAFNEMGLQRLEGDCDIRNAPSIQLMERLGMKREKTLIDNQTVKGELVSDYQYGIFRKDWVH